MLLITIIDFDLFVTISSTLNLLMTTSYSMEIIESIAWVTLGFLPMFGSMEGAWRLGKKRGGIRREKVLPASADYYKPITKEALVDAIH